MKKENMDCSSCPWEDSCQNRPPCYRPAPYYPYYPYWTTPWYWGGGSWTISQDTGTSTTTDTVTNAGGQFTYT